MQRRLQRKRIRCIFPIGMVSTELIEFAGMHIRRRTTWRPKHLTRSPQELPVNAYTMRLPTCNYEPHIIPTFPDLNFPLQKFWGKTHLDVSGGKVRRLMQNTASRHRRKVAAFSMILKKFVGQGTGKEGGPAGKPGLAQTDTQSSLGKQVTRTTACTKSSKTPPTHNCKYSHELKML
jgi:hypothetical protein